MIYSPSCPFKIVDFFFSFVEHKRTNSKECVNSFCPYNESQWGPNEFDSNITFSNVCSSVQRSEVIPASVLLLPSLNFVDI